MGLAVDRIEMWMGLVWGRGVCCLDQYSEGGGAKDHGGSNGVVSLRLEMGHLESSIFVVGRKCSGCRIYTGER